MPIDEPVTEGAEAQDAAALAAVEAPAEPTLPAGPRCLYILSAGDAIEVFERANAAAKDSDQPGAVFDLLTVDAVRTAYDEETGHATLVAVVDGQLRTFERRQNDQRGRTPGTWRDPSVTI